MTSKITVIKNFLTDRTVQDLSNLYEGNMECQVNVAQDGGERVEGDYKGKQWHGWTDGLQTWKSFRIPWNANGNPTFDKNLSMNFDFTKYVEGIGMTGWDWENRVSRWVAFDFDSIVGHAVGLTNQELEKILEKAQEIEWVTVRKSTSGGGIHLYVLLDPIKTDTHTEHSALARSVLGQMSAIAGYDFSAKVDACGGNMWVWHRKMEGTDGLKLIKQGTVLHNPPSNWKDHLPVIKGKRRKNLPQNIEQEEDLFLELTGQRSNVTLDSDHKKVISYLKDENAMWWWDSDHHMLVTHTYHVAKAHEALGMTGIFKTTSDGTNLEEQNCFLFPMRRGAWVVRRFTRGVQEADSWDQDESGWSRCYLNRQPDLTIASRTYEGIEHEKGGFIFSQAEMAIKAAGTLGTHISIPNWAGQRESRLKRHKDGRLIVEIKREHSDRADDMKGWLPEKTVWKRIFNTQVKDVTEQETSQYDDFIRHLATATGDDYGWSIKTDSSWRTEPLPHIRLSLKSMGFSQKDADNILGNSVLKCWVLVNRPFQPEYPGNREWNRNSAQLRFTPTTDTEQLVYPTWTRLLNHCGQGLDEAVNQDEWCRNNSIISGADYLKCWIASLLQEPLEPLPYLFFYGPQNSGKSIMHEALSLLLTKGYVRADHAIESPSGFNGELENAIICVVEEVNLSKSRTAYNRIKDWVTSKHLNIRKLYHSPYHIPNSTHWIQCANDSSYCPVFSGDTRITMCFVDGLGKGETIPKKVLLPMLEKEAPDFLSSVVHLELPKSLDRLNLPVVVTGDKEQLQQQNDTPLESFLSEQCHYVEGEIMTVAIFYDAFIEWLDPDEAHNWPKITMGKQMPLKFPKGRRKEDGHWCFGNISFEDKESENPKLITSGGKLIYGSQTPS